MRVISAESHSSYQDLHNHPHQTVLSIFKNWVDANEPRWSFYRFGIVATGILIQVTVAASAVAVLGMSGAPSWVFGIGILFAFMANSIAFAESQMRLVLGVLVASIIVNLAIALAYGLPLLIN